MENYRDRNQGQNNYDYPAWDVPEDGEYSDVDSFDEPDYDEPDYQGGYPSQGGRSVYGQGMPYPDNMSMRRGEAMNNRDMRRNPMRQDARPRRNTASGENMGFRRVLNERENIPGRRMPYSGQEVRELHGAQGVQAARENSGYAPVRESIPHENIVRDSASEEASISKLDKFIEDEMGTKLDNMIETQIAPKLDGLIETELSEKLNRILDESVEPRMDQFIASGIERLNAATVDTTDIRQMIHNSASSMQNITQVSTVQLQAVADAGIDRLQSTQVNTENIEELVQTSTEKIKRISDDALKKIKDYKLLEEENRPKVETASIGRMFDEKMESTNDYTHKECVKVYRNVQAIVVEEDGKVIDAGKENVAVLKKKLGIVTGIAIGAAGLSLVSVVLQILQMFVFR